MAGFILCLKKLLQPADPTILEEDDSEWIEPVRKESQRNVSTIEQSTMGRKSRASISVDMVKDQMEESRGTIRWADMVDSLDDIDRLSYLDDSKHDEEVMNSLAASDYMRESELFDTLGRITMGSLYTDDSVSRDLGGFTRYDDDSESSDDDFSSNLGKKVGGGKSNDVSTSGRATEVVSILKTSVDKGVAPGTGKELFKAHAKKVMFATATLKQFARPSTPTPPKISIRSDSSRTVVTTQSPVTSMAALSDGFFLTASVSGNLIKMYKTVRRGKVEFVRDFKGHKTGVTALVVLDRKGRFLSAGIDRSLLLWDSRFNIEEDSDDEAGFEQEPTTLLATFNSCFHRHAHSIGVLNEGSFVRPTDGVDMAMVTAMARMTALEGAASVQRAAIQREYIECSGSFATSSKNDKNVKIWTMAVTGKNDENVAQIHLDHELKHDASIRAMVTGQNLILAGDVVGDVHMWECERRKLAFGSKGSWAKTHKFTPWKTRVVHTPDEKSAQSIEKLCLLDGGTFVSGTKSGVVRVWRDIKSAKGFEVYKKHASSIKVTKKSVTDVQKLPPVKDPNTKEECMAFSVAFADGRLVSMALYPRGPSKKEKDELVMFHVYTNSSTGDNSKTSTAINSIVVSEAASLSFGREPVLIASDGNGDVKTLEPKWNSQSSASI
mmetsp:Transcript_14423/g.31344  ORF Transcript_14423/g.31344 Transcript_14423/m.31344 type:complete len:665 (+) Transcript_14423:298-2292(+)|eukprot:CAMPEP_0172552720 /NCGR_PEP_ID=MMETSP1067-20121228/47123_1 /TAXON_ID=265564 ORGANISM="Thalassiosira punctigera, Strain Tpunct2005C2" /NCGR_SAMPLE_ID=MMETSP1067 /ASSEMBLY_ACC=CAM_ASM_000444 /LENGTH=664 /DNA_ID=CAMNT_0013340769 /DNA_START=273 /DNA_END=2267 /DNA_ORIENTATION=-